MDAYTHFKYATEGQEIALKYLRSKGFRHQLFIGEDTTVPPTVVRVTRMVKIYAPDNDSPAKRITQKAGCMCGNCTKSEMVKPGAYVNVGVFEDYPATIWVGFTEDANETWERYDLHEPDALKIIEGRILWGLENWTPEKTIAPSWRDSLRKGLE